MTPSAVQFPATETRPAGAARPDAAATRPAQAFASALDSAGHGDIPSREVSSPALAARLSRAEPRESSPPASPARRAPATRSDEAAGPSRRDPARGDAADRRQDAPGDDARTPDASQADAAARQPSATRPPAGQSAATDGAETGTDKAGSNGDKADGGTDDAATTSTVDAAAQAAAALLAASQAVPAPAGPATAGQGVAGAPAGTVGSAQALLQAIDGAGAKDAKGVAGAAIGLSGKAAGKTGKAAPAAAAAPGSAAAAALAATADAGGQDGDAAIPAGAGGPDGKAAPGGPATPEMRISPSLQALSEALMSAGTPAGDGRAPETPAQGAQADPGIPAGLLQAGAPGRGAAGGDSFQAPAAGGTGQPAASVPVSALPIEIGMRALEGSQSFRIRLHPEELGQVEVKLHIDDDGVVKAEVTADRVETLAMLQRDAKTLERAFEQAGLKTSDSGLQFSLGSDGGQSAREQQQRQSGPAPGAETPTFAPLAGQDLASAIRAIRAAAGGLDIRI
jgi:flagellar hook-length control protein FliK